MMRTKKTPIRLERISHEYYSIYKLATDPKSHVNKQHAFHDIRLRDCLGKLFHNEDITNLKISNTGDAEAGGVYFEMDNGHMNEDQLRDKIQRYYSGKGKFIVIFWMATAEYAHWKTKENIKRLEKNRLNMLFDILKETMREKPNRILGACYSQFLEDGKLYTMKGDER